MEVDPLLEARARAALQPYLNVEVVLGSGADLHAGVFDAIFVNAGATEPSAAWLDSLASGGRLLCPLTVETEIPNVGEGQMLLVTRLSESYSARFVSPVRIFHCQGARTAEGDGLLQKAFARGGHDRVTTLRRDAHAATDTCWLHAERYCLSSVIA